SMKDSMATPDLVTGFSDPSATTPKGGLDLRSYGLKPGLVHANLSPAALTEMALRRGEGHLTEKGALTALTGARTGRSPQDRFLVPDPSRPDDSWWGTVNHRMETAGLDRRVAQVRRPFPRRQPLS